MAKSALGIDIGTKYIKYVELQHLGNNKYHLLSIGMAPVTSKGIESEAAIDQETLAISIKKLLKDGGVKTSTVIGAMPETHVFTRIVQVPPLSERELISAIKWEAEQYIPLPLEEVQLDFTVVGQSQDASGVKKFDVLLVAAPKKFIERYLKILDMTDLEVDALETEIISVSRALLPAASDRAVTAMVVNLGAKTTDLSILRNGVIAFTRSIPTGGEHFTKALAQDLGFPIPQAEEYKKTYGLRKNELEGKVFNSLRPLFGVVIEEIKRSITFFQNKFPDEVVSTIMLSGGTAKLPGLVEALVEETGVETQIGNPWARVEKDLKRFARLDEEGPIFAVACGLAMREN